jgi:hypothetical protein
MSKGDHLYVDTKWPGITHHGIDVGDGNVIHFFRDQNEQARIFDDQAPIVISETTKEVFRDGRKISIVPYRSCFSPDEVVATAKYFLSNAFMDESCNFDLRGFNCEHFATLCKVGRETSKQVDYADGLVAALCVLISL